MKNKLRIERAKSILDHWKLDALMIENPVDLFYLTGLELSIGKVVIERVGATLFVDGRFLARAKEVCRAAPIETLRLCGRVGFDSAFVSYANYLRMKAEGELVPIPAPLKEIRARKEEGEIAALRRAARLTWRGYQHVVGMLREGVREEELALEFEIFCLRHGASRLSFPPIVCFGENSAYPHHRACKTALHANQVVLIDVGAVVDGYAGDMTRMVHFGKVDPKIDAFEELVKRAKQDAIALIKPGVKVRELDHAARAVFREAGVEELFCHGLGHGVGLETHEYPRLKEMGEDREVVLEPGMVITIEPGLYLPGLGGVRLEDTLAVSETGCENFYDSDSIDGHASVSRNDSF